MSAPGAILCASGDVGGPTWVWATARAVAVVVLAIDPVSAGTPKAKGLLQADPGKERENFDVGTQF